MSEVTVRGAPGGRLELRCGHAEQEGPGKLLAKLDRRGLWLLCRYCRESHLVPAADLAALLAQVGGEGPRP